MSAEAQKVDVPKRNPSRSRHRDKSFADKRTAAVFVGNRVASLPALLQPRARRKLLMIDAAVRLGDLRVPPSNRLELLRGQGQGQHSIRINDQWRVCFEWRDGDALDVEITDYHRRTGFSYGN